MLGNTDVIVTRAAETPPCYCFIAVSFHDVWTLNRNRNITMPVVHRGGFRFCFVSVMWAPLEPMFAVAFS
jgi:hypothetical protein